MKKLLLFINAISMLLTACNGGSGNVATPSESGAATKIDLLPLNVSMNDLSGKQISYINVFMNNSHYDYKLTFTNPNSVTVSTPHPLEGMQQIGCDIDWADANGKLQMPGLCYVTDFQLKTTSADDCNNMKSIVPGGQCSFYIQAWNDVNGTTQQSFSYPVAYYIKQINSAEPNVLHVQQCTIIYQVQESGQYKIKYNCNNENKPGFSNQFVTYELNPTPTHFPKNLGYLSIDGYWSYRCSDALNCAKYQVSYDSATNNLSVATIPSYTFKLPAMLIGQQQFTTFTGNTNWYVGYDRGYNWYVVNSNEPNKDYWINGLGSASGVYGKTGLDNSFWINTDIRGAHASVYDPISDSFISTNLGNNSAIFGIDANGTVINGGLNEVNCSTSLASPMDYVSTPLLNYVASGNTYVYTQVSGLYIGTALGLYKIHTENGLCEIHVDDYYTNTYSSTLYTDFALVFSYITQAANIYTGL